MLRKIRDRGMLWDLGSRFGRQKPTRKDKPT